MRILDSTKLHDWNQLIGIIKMIASLIFVGFQIRQTQAIAESEAYQKLRGDLIAHIDEHPTVIKQLGAEGYLSHQSGKWWEGNFARGGFTHGMTRGFPEPGGRHGDDGLKIGREGMEPVFTFIDHALRHGNCATG